MIKRNLKGQFVKGSCSNSMLGKKHSKEAKIKIGKSNSKSLLGNKNCLGRNLSDYTKSKIGKSNAISQKGNKNRWKGGKTITLYGYILIYNPNHPFANKLGYVLEHRLIAEKHLGRYLTKLEVIHHIDEIKINNHPENLYLFSTTGNHTQFHFLKNKPKLISNLIRCNLNSPHFRENPNR